MVLTFCEWKWVNKLFHKSMKHFGIRNVGTLTSKSMDMVDTMIRKRINFMCLQENKWVGEKAKELDNLE